MDNRLILEKKKEHEAAAAKALKAGDYNTAFQHTVQAANYTLDLADRCEGAFKNAYHADANGLIEIAKKLKAKIKTAPLAEDKTADKGDEEAGDVGSLGERPKERLADVSGMEQAKNEILMGVIEPLKNPEKAKRYGLKLGGGLLLYGLPGTGKTFFAKAVAGELGLPFYVIKSSNIMGKYVGESEEAIQKVFDTARSNPMSVIFIDETNGLLPSRSGNVHEVSKKVAEIILQETDGIDSKSKNPFLLIGATNYPGDIDDAALSRFTTVIEVELPDHKTRKFILGRELRSMQIDVPDNSLEFLAEKTQNFSCRDLVNLSSSLRKAAAKEEISAVSVDFCERNFIDCHVESADVAKSVAEFKKRTGAADGKKKKSE